MRGQTNAGSKLETQSGFLALLEKAFWMPKFTIEQSSSRMQLCNSSFSRGFMDWICLIKRV